MTNRRKLLAYATLPVLGLGLIGGATAVSAQGFGMFGQHATPAEMATRANEMFSEILDKVKERFETKLCFIKFVTSGKANLSIDNHATGK